MPGLNESFFASKSLALAAAAIAFLAAAGLLSFIFRLTFGRRLRLPRNGRARPPRLGTVDAFDLDRQRQLVIIRRDNVEHLLMIGGPNDVVIESEIIRAESRDPRDLREARIRDKELRESRAIHRRCRQEFLAFSGGSATAEYSAAQMPFPPAPLGGAGAGSSAASPSRNPRGFRAPIVLPTASAVFPPPPRRMPPPVTPLGKEHRNSHEPLHGGAGEPQKPELGTNPTKGFARAPVATPFLCGPGAAPGARDRRQTGPIRDIRNPARGRTGPKLVTRL